jgi:hypothetical protein
MDKEQQPARCAVAELRLLSQDVILRDCTAMDVAPIAPTNLGDADI